MPVLLRGPWCLEDHASYGASLSDFPTVELLMIGVPYEWSLLGRPRVRRTGLPLARRASQSSNVSASAWGLKWEFDDGGAEPSGIAFYSTYSGIMPCRRQLRCCTGLHRK
ncbi:hypothetical protein CFRS1_v012003 [Colletotrichum fructicola]|nr:hypothetical protein CFRS1_v012003 [Colletotrichum fructicola]